MENGIRQGKVLSGPEFWALVGDVEVEFRAEGLGIKYGHLVISSLLLLDDIAITSFFSEDIKILGWCPAGPVFTHGEKVPLKPWLATLLEMISQ